MFTASIKAEEPILMTFDLLSGSTFMMTLFFFVVSSIISKQGYLPTSTLTEADLILLSIPAQSEKKLKQQLEKD